jgi:hypothetical protein
MLKIPQTVNIYGEKVIFTIVINKQRVLLMSASGTLFKDPKRRNYFIKKSNTSISDALITHIFMISYLLKGLNQ